MSQADAPPVGAWKRRGGAGAGYLHHAGGGRLWVEVVAL